jgi:hypothetical protein
MPLSNRCHQSMDKKMEKSGLQFDNFGRLIPAGFTQKVNTSSRRYFKVNEAKPNNAAIYQNTADYLGQPEGLSLTQFEAKVAALHARLGQDELLKNLDRCDPIPFILPKGSITDDLTASMSVYVAGLGASFSKEFPKNRFTDHSIDEWRNQLVLNPKSRGATLLARSKTESVVGLFLPSLSEYSVPAAYEAVLKSPDSLLLSGFFEISSVLIGTPGYLINSEAYSPLLWATANIADHQAGGFHFAAYGNDMTLNYRAHLNAVSEYWWSGLEIIDDGSVLS